MKIQILAVGLVFVATSAAMADERRVVITAQDCSRLVEHKPAPDVAYRPGIDVRGRSVAPADLPGSRIDVQPPKEIEFEVSFNPLKGGAARFGETTLGVGRLRYDLAKGEITLNGQPLSDPELAEIARKCQNIVKPGVK